MRKKAFLVCLTIMLYIGFFIPFFTWDSKVKAIVALVIIQILWIGKVFPLAFSSLLLMLLLSFHFFTYEETLSYFSSGIVWLLFSTYIISKAFIDTGLASRISLMMLKLSRGRGSILIFISFILMFVLSALIPSNVGKGSLVSSVLDSLIVSLKRINNVENLAKSLFIGVAYLASISGVFVATGASSTIYTFGMFSEFNHELNYLSWILIFGIPILVFIVIQWLIFLLCFPPETIDKKMLMELLEIKINDLGKMSLREKKVLGVIGLTLILWMTQYIHGYSIPQIGLLGACLTVFPVIGVWKWEQAKKSVDWDMILFFASTLMVSGMLLKTGTVDWMAAWLNDILKFQSPFLIVTILVVCTVVLRIFFVNILGFLTIMLPLAITIGQTMPGVSPLFVAMPVFLAGVPGFFLITQSPVHLISFSYGYFSEKDLLRVGIFAAFSWILIILLSAFYYWQ